MPDPENQEAPRMQTIEALKHLSLTQRTEFDRRQKLEWRLIFTALTFYVLTVVGIYKTSIGPLLRPYETLITIVYGSFLFVILASLMRIHMNHAVNKNAANEAEDQLWKIAGISPKNLFQPEGLTKSLCSFFRREPFTYVAKRRWAGYILPQAFMLSLFTFASWWIVTSKIEIGEQLGSVTNVKAASGAHSHSEQTMKCTAQNREKTDPAAEKNPQQN